MRCNAEPYEGSRPYIFVSYCHKDQMQVYPYIEMLAREGYRIWYDEGITPGAEWTENIARHLEGCSFFIAFITEASLNSHNCRREINFAVLKDKNIVSLFLDDVNLSAGMEMLLSGKQGIYRSKYLLAEEYLAKLKMTEGLDICKGNARPEVQVLDRIDVHERTVALTQSDEAFFRTSSAETYLLRVATLEKVFLRKSSFSIGRSDEHSDYVIPGEPSISRRHMIVLKKGEVYSVVDDRSVNHVGINGKRLNPDIEYEISPYDIITLAKEHFVFFREYSEDSAMPGTDLCLCGRSNNYPIPKQAVVRIGSLGAPDADRNGAGNEICLPGTDIMKHHAILIRTPMGMYVANISGRGKVALDDEPIPYGRRALIESGHRLTIGDQSFVIANRA